MALAEYISDGSELDALFPTPSLPPTVLCPQRYPGCSPASVAALRYVLKDNHIKYHIFFNDKQHHNHITHRALALYATGASGSLIEQFYKKDSTYQRSVVDPPEVVTDENFVEHLGDENYYSAYVAFFVKAIKEKGVSATLDEYIFAKKYNFVEGRDASTQPVMLSRFLGGLFHPFIHVGHGIEFGIPGMVAEGLAMASVHLSDGPMFLPPSLFQHGSTTAAEEVTTRLSSLLLSTKASTAPSQLEQPKGNHAFSILAKVMQDSEFAPKEMQNHFDESDFTRLLTDHGASIWRYAEQWTIDLSQPDELERKMEECIWTSTILYAVGGWSKEKGFRANFFSMHFVTSSLFLSALLPHLETHKVTLLRAYFALILAWWIALGRPRPDDIQEFLDATASPPSSEGEVPNPFLNFVQSGITHPSAHTVKIQRALAHFSSLYGACPKGYLSGTELEVAEALDGSLFFRAARLTDEYMGQGTMFWHV